MESELYKVKTPIFEGSLELLLNLIEKRKLLINEISLAEVADDFIAHAKGLDKFPVAESANFILVASTLVLIKSRSLLPVLTLTEEEESSVADLERRLKIYQRTRELSRGVGALFGKRPIFLPRPPERAPVFSPDSRLSVVFVAGLIREILKNLPKTEKLTRAVVEKVVSLEEMIENLTQRVNTCLKMNFRDFAKIGKEKKVNVVVSFLAMLELVKQGVIAVTQNENFGDIEMETENLGVPKY
ncbi:MAG: ScpA family protein [Candidatus Paceibacterota bacterium]|jgi:segregation and condensation protein A